MSTRIVYVYWHFKYYFLIERTNKWKSIKLCTLFCVSQIFHANTYEFIVWNYLLCNKKNISNFVKTKLEKKQNKQTSSSVNSCIIHFFICLLLSYDSIEKPSNGRPLKVNQNPVIMVWTRFWKSQFPECVDGFKFNLPILDKKKP